MGTRRHQESKPKRYDRIILDDYSRHRMPPKGKKKHGEPSEDSPTHESMSGKRQFGWNAREQGDRLNPLFRMLESNVGRPWNKVFSEIGADSRSLDGYHLLQHIELYVEESEHTTRFSWFYVDDHGILRKDEERGNLGRKRIRYVKKVGDHAFTISNNWWGFNEIQYHKVSRHWYKCFLMKVESPQPLRAEDIAGTCLAQDKLSSKPYDPKVALAFYGNESLLCTQVIKLEAKQAKKIEKLWRTIRNQDKPKQPEIVR